MAWIWIMTVAIGIASVLQGGLNKNLAKDLGLPLAVLINGILFFIAAAVYWFFNRQNMPEPSGSIPWWILAPGLFGFVFVLGVPAAIARLGATPVFVALVATQIAGGIAWDLTIEGQPISLARWVGAGLAMAGALVMVKG